MAKIVNGSLVLDPDDYIDFVDGVGDNHKVYWDDILDRFLFDGTVEADQFVGTTNAVVASRNPQPNDDTYEVPTVWVNNTTNNAWLLVSVAPGNAIWKDFASGGSGVDHRITINSGMMPDVSEVEAFDMWISLEE